MTAKQIADATSLPERTVTRIFSGDTHNPYMDTLHRIVTALGSSLNDICGDTKLVLGEENLAELREAVDAVTTERDSYKAEVELLKAEVANLSTENKMLHLELKYKNEIIALHNHYGKIKSID